MLHTDELKSVHIVLKRICLESKQPVYEHFLSIRLFVSHDLISQLIIYILTANLQQSNL